MKNKYPKEKSQPKIHERDPKRHDVRKTKEIEKKKGKKGKSRQDWKGSDDGDIAGCMVFLLFLHLEEGGEGDLIIPASSTPRQQQAVRSCMATPCHPGGTQYSSKPWRSNQAVHPIYHPCRGAQGFARPLRRALQGTRGGTGREKSWPRLWAGGWVPACKPWGGEKDWLGLFRSGSRLPGIE